ncbi:Nuclear import receptor [Dispira simplex]|nr:Nuclear import receptor [Dispira simplex]
MANGILDEVNRALQTLYQSTNAEEKQKANTWLLDFQRTPQAWSAADGILNTSTGSPEGQIFAAQTLRHKITYDLVELGSSERTSLRDSLLNLLYRFRQGPKVVTTQICLSLAGLALQMAEWENVVGQMVQLFGTSRETIDSLIQFLTVLPEEVNTNDKIVMDSELYHQRTQQLLTDNAHHVLEALTGYMQSAELSTDTRGNVLQCFTSWLKSGDIEGRLLSQNPLLNLAFNSLPNPDLFEVAVDAVCAIIHETRDLTHTVDLVQTTLCPLLLNVRTLMATTRDQEDPELMRGFCRIFTEACEAYLPLILNHWETFRGIVEALAECVSFPDLDIVPMTFMFWEEFARRLSEPRAAALKPSVGPVFSLLERVMIDHLRYPADLNELTAEQQDQFRNFRHDMGDVLKDCVVVLGADQALQHPHDLLVTQLEHQGQEGGWQIIEAALFSLRAMGSEISPGTGVLLPKIMELLPRLPNHPKIRYAATLVIGRYTFWTAVHPDLLLFQLNFICEGFSDSEVAAASAMALRYLCADCGQWMTQYLEQLHQLYTSVIGNLCDRDAQEITEAVAHVVASLPGTQVLAGLQPFCENYLNRLVQLVERGSAIQDPERQELALILDRISVFLTVAAEDAGPKQLISLVEQVWPLVQQVTAIHYQHSIIAERACRFYRCCTGPFASLFTNHLSELINTLASAFRGSGLSCYLWIAKCCIQRYSRPDTLVPQLVQLAEQLTMYFYELVNIRGCTEIPDVVEDYFCLMQVALREIPGSLLETTWFPASLGYIGPMFAMSEAYALGASFRFFTHALTLVANPGIMSSTDNDSPLSPTGIAQLRAVFHSHGLTMTEILVRGLTEGLDPNFIPSAATALSLHLEIFESEALQWLGEVLTRIPNDKYPAVSKQKVMRDLQTALEKNASRLLPRAFRDFAAVYRRRNRLGLNDE